MRLRSRSLRRGDGGQSLVEFGLVAPVLLLVLTGIFSFGIILSQYEVLTDSVSAGARAFALSRLQTTPALAVSDPCAYAISILEGAAPNLTSSSMNFTIVYTDNSGTTPSVSNYTTTCTDRASTGSSKMHSEDQVQITATYPVTPLVFSRATRTLTMSATATELVN
ncbi:MAG TPA: TadE/TadG family type IV pilus assembly protein [Acidobacteriaceae bacterium]|nr:TadE/TadG family type IV pilus assembly protein [Acidobacteriaceae bacterium]